MRWRDAGVLTPDQLRRLGRTAVPAAALTGRQDNVRPDDLPVVLYTSGTTGPKKGCALSHGNYVSVLRAHPAPPPRPDDAAATGHGPGGTRGKGQRSCQHEDRTGLTGEEESPSSQHRCSRGARASTPDTGRSGGVRGLEHGTVARQPDGCPHGTHRRLGPASAGGISGSWAQQPLNSVVLGCRRPAPAPAGQTHRQQLGARSQSADHREDRVRT
ncbi:AMP-binding protein [Streptomyces halobius]|uniref:AMP-binding protein n=1 Tax=Streptomyces halobius TaxID=2879846 RepID=UPI0029E7DECF|nr:AMP-binding protein [Streptomyces halobius]